MASEVKANAIHTDELFVTESLKVDALAANGVVITDANGVLQASDTFPTTDFNVQASRVYNTGSLAANGTVTGTYTLTTPTSGIYEYSAGTYTFLADADVDISCSLQQGTLQAQAGILLNGVVQAIDFTDLNTSWCSASWSGHVTSGQTISCKNLAGTGSSSEQIVAVRAMSKKTNILSASLFNSQFPNPSITTSATKTPTASHWHAMSSNAVVLLPGTYSLSAQGDFNNNGSATNYSSVAVGIFGANGADSATLPTTLNATPNVTVLSAGLSYAITAASGNFAAAFAPEIIVRLTAATAIYAVPYSSQTTPSTARIVTYLTAKRIADYMLYGSVNRAPSLTRYISGSGNYLTPAGVRYLRIRIVGGGGGGAGSFSNSGGNAGNGSNGGTSSFGTSLLSCSGGFGGSGNSTGGGLGGTASLGTGPIGFTVAGGGGSGGLTVGSYAGSGVGGNSFFGGAGASSGGNGNNAATNSGSGGSGGGTNNLAGSFTGSGGGAGGYLEAFIYNPLPLYAYVVGGGGNGGSAGTNAYWGGNGAAGQIIIEEYY